MKYCRSTLLILMTVLCFQVHAQGTYSPIQTWQVDLGSYPNLYSILTKYKKEDIACSAQALQALTQVNILDTVRKITLVKVTSSDLGYPNGESLEVLRQKAVGFGYQQCPLEAALLLRLQDLGYIRQGDGYIVVSDFLKADDKSFLFVLGYSQVKESPTIRRNLGIIPISQYATSANPNDIMISPEISLIFMKK